MSVTMTGLGATGDPLAAASSAPELAHPDRASATAPARTRGVPKDLMENTVT
jgi:hypothetical protein